MTARRKIILFLLALVALVGLAVVLGGSMIWHLIGLRSADIEGHAAPVDRPASSIGVGEGWKHYGGDAGGNRYSLASEINRDTLHLLSKVWHYQTGDLTENVQAMGWSAAQATPILVEDSLVFCTPFNEMIALDPGTGQELWRFDPEIDLQQFPANQFVCRGVAYWRDAEQSTDCASRLFMATNDGRLIAVDAARGTGCTGFGDEGEVRIDPGMDLIWPGEFQFTSAPVTVGDTLIVGSSISDGVRLAAPTGSVRAFDARTGEPRWSWDPIPRSREDPASATWLGAEPPEEGRANAWAPLAVDEQRGLVFVPTSSASPDFYGGLRPGDNRHTNSVVALEAASGQVRWSFQIVHHDIWDYDLPAQPGLYSVWREGEVHDVVAQVTKTGHVFVLDRDTGEPFLPIEERAVPQSGAPGEWLSPTQPFPVATPAIVPTHLTPDDAFGLTWLDKSACRNRILDSVSDGLFTPPSEQGTLLYPFNGGGANWGSAAYDPARNLLIINMNSLAHHVQLIPTEGLEEAREVFHDQEILPQTGAPYAAKREIFLSPWGIPCSPPPWGVLAAINLATGEIVWRKPIGKIGGFELGAPTLGGPMVTAGGLVFIASTMDDQLHAFDVATGALLWRAGLPASGQATPMSYQWQDRQFVVVYAGGNARSGSRMGDSIVAFALQ